MRTLFRYLLAFMIVVLPLQGSAVMLMPYGAGTAMARGMADMQVNQPSATDTLPAMTAMTAMTAMSGDGHCSHAATPERKAKSAHVKCHAGTNCCVGGAAAPPCAPAILPTRFLSAAAQAAREPAMTVVVPPTLERPPRLA